MGSRTFYAWGMVCGFFCSCSVLASAEQANKPTPRDNAPTKIYVPYDKLTDVFETEGQGVFLPYAEFQRLWRTAQGAPAGVGEAPFKYLISTARFTGQVEGQLARLHLELTIDVLADGWVEAPIGLGDVAVSNVRFLEPEEAKVKPLLRVTNGQYVLMTKGKGRYVLAVDFVRQLEIKPGLHVLKYRMPAAAIATLRLTIPEENLKVDVEPMLAATTTQAQSQEQEGAVTILQAFMGSAEQVQLSWKPKTEAAAELKPVFTAEQFQHLHVAEALISYEATFTYTIRRGGIDSFVIQLPDGFRVTAVEGENIAKWDIEAAGPAEAPDSPQRLEVKLFSAAKEQYLLRVRMERFLQETHAEVPLSPMVTAGALQRAGLIGITHSPRRQVELQKPQYLARVDTGRLPEHLRNMSGATAYRFISGDYAAVLAVDTTLPRITVNQLWTLKVEKDRLSLQGSLRYTVERAGIFELNMQLPEPWVIESVGPRELVDDYQVKQGDGRILHVLLTQEQMGEFTLELKARADRPAPTEPVRFVLPLPDAENLRLYSGQFVLLMPPELRATLKELHQMQAVPASKVKWAPLGEQWMAYEFRDVERGKEAGASFDIVTRPAQVSAVVHRLVDIEPGSVQDKAVVKYHVNYAPVDTFYLKMPQSLLQWHIRITGSNIKEQGQINEPPAGEAESTAEDEDLQWVYRRVILQSGVVGNYELTVHVERDFKAPKVGESSTLEVAPILAAGRLAYQKGHIAIAKADTLAIGEPTLKNLEPGDPTSARDLPHKPHQQKAALAFTYSSPPFQLSLPVAVQEEVKVFTTMSPGVLVEQVLARDGILNSRVTYLLATCQGDRLPITLPGEVQLTAVLLNGNETPLEMGAKAQERLVRLPPSAGQVSKFVLEIAYSTEKASASSLQAPSLPADVPVQQTLWRLWLPKDYRLLSHDRTFSRVADRQTNEMLSLLNQGQPSAVGFKLPGQGAAYNFVRSGPPGQLSVIAIGKEWFSVMVWAVIVGVGVLMLKLNGFHRCLVILAAGLLAGILHLYLPLLVRQTVRVGLFAVLLVLVLWMIQWIFVRRPRWKRRAALAGAPGADAKTVNTPTRPVDPSQGKE